MRNYYLYIIKFVGLLNILSLSTAKINFNSYIKNMNSDSTQDLRLKLYQAELRLNQRDLELSYIKFRINRIEKIIDVNDDTDNFNATLNYNK